VVCANDDGNDIGTIVDADNDVEDADDANDPTTASDDNGNVALLLDDCNRRGDDDGDGYCEGARLGAGVPLNTIPPSSLYTQTYQCGAVLNKE
jgi:hypothetical protein